MAECEFESKSYGSPVVAGGLLIVGKVALMADSEDQS